MKMPISPVINMSMTSHIGVIANLDLGIHALLIQDMDIMLLNMHL